MANDMGAALAKVKKLDMAAALEAVKAKDAAIPAADASAAGATGGGNTPLRAKMFLRDTVIPSVRAIAPAPGIAAAEGVAMAAGAVPSFVAGASQLAGYPEVGEKVREYGWDIESRREQLGVPTMRAAQDIEAAPLPARMAARGVEMATSGLGFNAPIAMKIASNPAAVMKIGAIIDSGAGMAGEAAATIAKALGADPSTQEAGRAWTSLVTAMGGPAAVNFARGSVMGLKDALVPKPIARLEQDVGAQLAANRLNDPAVFDTARTNAQEFTSRGMQPPPLGSLTGNPTLIAEQQAALREVPGLAQTEQTRQAATDAAIRGQVAQAAPEGDVEDVGWGLVDSLNARNAQARAEMRALDRQLYESQMALLRNKQALKALVEASGDSLEGTVRTLTEAAEQRSEAVLWRLGPGMGARAAGDVFVDELDKAQTEFRKLAQPAYEGFFAGSESSLADFPKIQTAAVTAAAPGNPVSPLAVPEVVQDIIDSAVTSLTPKQLHSLRSKLLNEMGKAQGGANADPQKARMIYEVLEAVDSEFERIGKNLPGWEALNAWYREGKKALYSGRFKDVGRELTARGGAEVDPSVIAGRFLNADTAAGADEAVEDFNRAYGGQLGLPPQAGLPDGIAPRLPSAIAGKALDEHIVERLRLAVTDNTQLVPKINGTQLVRWVREHQVALARRPELAKRLNSVAGAQALINEEVKRIASLQREYESLLKQAALDPADVVLASRVQERKRELDSFRRATESEAGRWRKAFAVAVEDSQGRIDQIAGKNATDSAYLYRELEKELAGNEPALKGLKKGMWEALTKRVVDPETGAAAPSPLVNSASFAKLMQTHGPLVERLFGPERKELLNVMKRLAKRNTAVSIPTPSLEDIGGPGRIGKMLSHIVSRSWSVARGVVGPGYVATEALMRAIFGTNAGTLNQANYRKLLTAALYDGDVYQDLLKAGAGLKSRTATRRLAARMSYGRQGLGMLLDNRATRTLQDIRAMKEQERQSGAPTPGTGYGGVRG